ncbi:DUF2062 domain-containing protein [Cognatazoarcus halotolerans]|uniref:DUF2062 domain-containing protein n=1 Tax=Cognatazoarcus halotolerans TaxID=2686016 RepID=UPI001358FAAC|nr:DUF2062 domain-containing protein [Cognatazoarcus halotolerans]
MRNLLKTYLPDPDAIRSNRWLAPFGNTLLHPRLWHLNRHSAAGAVAVGLFCGLIPGPFQMLGAAICCVVFRVNLPLALLTTLYTNPFTIVPLYLAAFGVGEWLIGSGSTFTPPPELGSLPISNWAGALIDWMAGLGKPLALGLIAMAGALSTSGYLIVRGLWRWHLIRAWRKRAMRKRGS